MVDNNKGPCNIFFHFKKNKKPFELLLLEFYE